MAISSGTLAVKDYYAWCWFIVDYIDSKLVETKLYLQGIEEIHPLLEEMLKNSDDNEHDWIPYSKLKHIINLQD